MAAPAPPLAGGMDRWCGEVRLALVNYGSGPGARPPRGVDLYGLGLPSGVVARRAERVSFVCSGEEEGRVRCGVRVKIPRRPVDGTSHWTDRECACAKSSAGPHLTRNAPAARGGGAPPATATAGSVLVGMEIELFILACA